MSLSIEDLARVLEVASRVETRSPEEQHALERVALIVDSLAAAPWAAASINVGELPRLTRGALSRAVAAGAQPQGQLRLYENLSN